MLLNVEKFVRLIVLSLVVAVAVSALVSAEDTILKENVGEVGGPETRGNSPAYRPTPCPCNGQPPKPPHPHPKPCPCLPLPKDFCYQAATVPIYRYYDSIAKDHYYSQAKPEADKKKWANDIEYEGVAWRCFPKPEEGTVPLYAYYNREVGDNFYTVDWNECRASASGWDFLGILCYISPVARKNTLQLYRYWSPRRTDHFYTTNWEELGCGNSHWVVENSPGFVCPLHKNDEPIEACEGSFGPLDKNAEVSNIIDSRVNGTVKSS